MYKGLSAVPTIFRVNSLRSSFSSFASNVIVSPIFLFAVVKNDGSTKHSLAFDGILPSINLGLLISSIVNILDTNSLLLLLKYLLNMYHKHFLHSLYFL